jgi:hypothetical protein
VVLLLRLLWCVLLLQVLHLQSAQLEAALPALQMPNPSAGFWYGYLQQMWAIRGG